MMSKYNGSMAGAKARRVDTANLLTEVWVEVAKCSTQERLTKGNQGSVRCRDQPIPIVSHATT